MPASEASATGRGERSPWLDVGPNGEGLHVFDFPTYRIGRLSGLIRRSVVSGYVEPHGLSIPEWRLLAFLVLSVPASFNEICAHLTMDRAHVSRTLPVLEKRGLIKRRVVQRKGPLRRGESGRQIRFAATAKGRALYRQALPVAQRHQMTLLSALDGDERAALYSILEKLTRAVVCLEQEHAPAVPEKTSVGNGTQGSAKPKRSGKPRTANGRATAVATPLEKRLHTGGLT